MAANMYRVGGKVEGCSAAEPPWKSLYGGVAALSRWAFPLFFKMYFQSVVGVLPSIIP